MKKLSGFDEEVTDYRFVDPHTGDRLSPVDAAALRLAYLFAGNIQFGCHGTHAGVGKQGCPYAPHHHHDIYCAYPTPDELSRVGLDAHSFKVASRG